MDRKEYVQKLSEVLQLAKPHLTCEYMLGKDVPLTELDKLRIKIHEVSTPYYDEEYVLVHCENGKRYEINITGDSLCAIAEEVFTRMASK